MGRTGKLATGVVAASLAMLAAAPADAARVRIDGTKLVIDNAATETNAVSLTAANGLITVFDSKHNVNAASGCSQVGDARAQCPAGAVTSIEASLGGFNDSYDSALSLPAVIDGGSGDDVLNGGGGRDVINAGLGQDTLDGRGGNDTLNGQGGPDLLIAGPGADFFDGGDAPLVGALELAFLLTGDAFPSISGIFNAIGAGFDAADLPDGIEYAGHTTTGVSLSLDFTANDGQPGEGDDVRDIEILGGTVHSDTIVGSPFSETLIGTPGGSLATKPVLVSDTLQGRQGNDYIDARGGAKDVIECGSNEDFASLDLVDPAVADCESTQRAAIRQHPIVLIRRVRVRGTRARVRLRCPRKAKRTCAGKLSVRSKGKRLGRTKFKVRRGRSRTVSVGLGRRPRGKLVVTAAGKDRNRKPITATRTFRVR